MSNPESFIDEVTEEVRRDKLFGYLRRYGWIAIVAVLLIVGGAAWREYQIAQRQAESEAFGDAVLERARPGRGRGARSGARCGSGTGTARGRAWPAAGDRPGRATARRRSTRLTRSRRTRACRPAIAIWPSLRRVIVAGADLPLAERRSLLQSIAHPGGRSARWRRSSWRCCLVEAGRYGRCDCGARHAAAGSGGTSRACAAAPSR